MKAFSFTAILLAASLISLSGCRAPLSVEGKTFSAEKSRYVFGKDSAELQLLDEEWLISVHNTPFGDYLFRPSTFEPSKESILGVATRTGVRYFVTQGTGVSYKTDGTAVATEGSAVFPELSVADSTSGFSEGALRSIVGEAMTSTASSAFHDFNAAFYPLSGSKTNDEAAYPSILASLSNHGSEDFAVSFWVTHDVITGPKQGWHTVATVPYEVLNTTVRIDLSAADFSAKIDQAPLLQKKYQYIRDAGKVVFRVEDDENFLYNPVTGNRYTRQ
jgi:hypothetical protein